MSGNPGRFDDFKYATRVRALNLWVQIALGAVLFAGLNFPATTRISTYPETAPIRSPPRA